MEFRQLTYFLAAAHTQNFVKRLKGCGATLIPPALLWHVQLNDDLALLPIADVTETFIFALAYRRTESLTVPARQFMNTVVEATSFIPS